MIILLFTKRSHNHVKFRETKTGLGTITFIGKGAFNGCTNLNSIKGLVNVNYIGDNAFNECIYISQKYHHYNMSHS